jgi:hypothetical protein
MLDARFSITSHDIKVAPAVKPTINTDEITPMCRYSEPNRVWYKYIRTITTPIPTEPAENTRNVLSKLEVSEDSQGGLPCPLVFRT